VDTYRLSWAGRLLEWLDLCRYIGAMPYWPYRLGLHRISLLTPLFAPRPSYQCHSVAARCPEAERAQTRRPHPKPYCHARLRGSAWTADTLLERARRENLRLEAADGVRRDFRYPWDAVAAHNPDYRAYVAAEMARMGPEHPLIRTQYLLDPIESGGRFLSETQLAQLRGDHFRLTSPIAQAPARADEGTSPPTVREASAGARPYPNPLPEGEG
jgi:hypothetical protein